MKLVTFQPVQALALPGLRPGQLLTFEPGKVGQAYGDWRIHVRGPSVYLVSPPGWQPGRNVVAPLNEPRRVYEVPRSSCYIGWETQPGDKLETRDWSPPCDDCKEPITLADHLVCAKCTAKRDEQLVELAARVAEVGGQPDLIPMNPAHLDNPEVMEALGDRVAIIEQPTEETDELPTPTRTRKHR